MINPFDIPDDVKLYGSYVVLSEMTEGELTDIIGKATEMLLRQMHMSVNPYYDISLIFNMTPTGKDDKYSVTGAWKCYARKEEDNERKTEPESGK